MRHDTQGGRGTSRRMLLEALIGLGATTAALHASADTTTWRAYEAVEEAWIRDRFELLIQQAPAALNAARIDLEIRLVDLQRRAVQFRHLLSKDPNLLRGGVWQLTSLPISEGESSSMLAQVPEYRKHTDRVRQLTDALRRHPQYEILQRAQVRLWKTPQYRDVHRRYTGRMQDLQRLYGNGGGVAAADALAGGGR